MTSTLFVTPAQMIWSSGSAPKSSQFDDYYYSSDNGIAETEHVYIRGNQLQERFSSLSDNATFIIAETGFGAGLNFAVCYQYWCQLAPKNARLIYLSSELFPLKYNDLKRISQQHHITNNQQNSTLASCYSELLEQYPPLVKGRHLCQLKNNVTLHLLFGDNDKSYQQFLQQEQQYNLPPHWQVDAWFLDGFTPSKNHTMWSPMLFKTMSKLSGEHTTVATFTAASFVRKALLSSGFSVQKISGYGKKREMLVANYTLASISNGLQTNTTALNAKSPDDASDSINDCSANDSATKTISTYWSYLTPKSIGVVSKFSDETNDETDDETETSRNTIAIIGAGVSGCLTARALADRGKKVLLLDEKATPAMGASGNPQAAIYGKLSAGDGELESFVRDALVYAPRAYQQWGIDLQQPSIYGHASGLIQLAKNSKDKQRMLEIARQFSHTDIIDDKDRLARWIKQPELSQVSNASLSTDACGLFLPHSGWIQPLHLLNKVIDHPNITFLGNRYIHKIEKQNSQQWQLYLRNNTDIQVANVVICSGYQAKHLLPLQWLPTKPIRGQITQFQSQGTEQISTVICREGYITPADSTKSQCVGATYHLHDDQPICQLEDDIENMQLLDEMLSLDTLNTSVIGQRAGIRASTPDYLPISGPVPIYEQWLKDFSMLRKDRKWPYQQSGQCHSGLWLNVGFGSRGFCYAPLCAQHIAAQMNNEPSPIDTTMARALHPGRFIIRDLSRGRI